MSSWKGWRLTAAGARLQTKVEAGEPLVLKEIAVGSGDAGEDNLADYTSLKKLEQRLPISGKEITDQGTVKITAVMVNTELTEGFFVREMGLYATDPDEGDILYLVAVDSLPDYFPAFNGESAISEEFVINIKVSDSANVVINLDGAALVSSAMLRAEIEAHNTNPYAHAELFKKALNAETAKRLAEKFKLSLAGDVSGSVAMDGSGDVMLQATVAVISNETIAEILDSEYVPGEDAVPLTNSDIDSVF